MKNKLEKILLAGILSVAVACGVGKALKNEIVLYTALGTGMLGTVAAVTYAAYKDNNSNYQ